jgi:hypothetical protein
MMILVDLIKEFINRSIDARLTTKVEGYITICPDPQTCSSKEETFIGLSVPNQEAFASTCDYFIQLKTVSSLRIVVALLVQILID